MKQPINDYIFQFFRKFFNALPVFWKGVIVLLPLLMSFGSLRFIIRDVVGLHLGWHGLVDFDVIFPFVALFLVVFSAMATERPANLQLSKSTLMAMGALPQLL